MDLQTKNNDLTSKLVQANESIRKHAEIIADLKRRDEENRLALTREGIKYDTMITQKLDDIAKLREENRSLCDLLNETEIKLVHSNDTILLLRNDSMATINVLRTSLTALDEDKEKLLARADSLKNEIASCEDSTARVSSELQALSRQNEVLRADLETVKNTNDQLLRARENDSVKRPLKNALCTLPGRIYDRIVRLQEDDDEGRDDGADNSVKATEYRSNEIISDTDDDIGRKERSTKSRANEVHANKLVKFSQFFLSFFSFSFSVLCFYLSLSHSHSSACTRSLTNVCNFLTALVSSRMKNLTRANARVMN